MRSRFTALDAAENREGPNLGRKYSDVVMHKSRGRLLTVTTQLPRRQDRCVAAVEIHSPRHDIECSLQPLLAAPILEEIFGIHPYLGYAGQKNLAALGAHVFAHQLLSRLVPELTGFPIAAERNRLRVRTLFLAELLISAVILCVAGLPGRSASGAKRGSQSAEAALGKRIFLDPGLSPSAMMACSTQGNWAWAGSFEMMGCDPDANPKTKGGHQRGEDERVNDLPSLPPNLCQAPLASALLRI